MENPLIFVVLCFFGSFLFSFSETALTSLGKLEIQSIIARGGWRAHIIQRWIRDSGRVLITVLVGNNIVNTIASSVFALWANHNFSGGWVPALIVAFTIVLILGSEIVPKLLAQQLAIPASPFSLRFLQAVDILLFPATFTIHKIARGILRNTGRTGGAKPLISEEDVTHTIEMATKEGSLDHETGEVLSNLIEFPDRLARDIMTPRARIQALSVGMTLEECLKVVSTDGHSRYPIVRNNLDELVGILLVKDLLAHIQRGNPGSWTRCVRRPYFVSELAPLGNILRDMKRWGTHLALVRNETGVLTGLLTLEDLIEEIVGEIRDEHDDPGEAGGDRAMGGPVLINGDIPILDFNERFGLTLPMDISYSTLNGYLLMKTGGEVPPIGTLIVDEEVTFRVHSVADSGVVTVQLLLRSNKPKEA